MKWESARRAAMFDKLVGEMGTESILKDMSDMVIDRSIVRYREGNGRRVDMWGLLQRAETEGGTSDGGRHDGVG